MIPQDAHVGKSLSQRIYNTPHFLHLEIESSSAQDKPESCLELNAVSRIVARSASNVAHMLFLRVRDAIARCGNTFILFNKFHTSN
jgi:hypothetical protein